MGLGERVCCRAGLTVRGGMEGLVDKGFALRGGTGGAFRSRHSSLTWRRKEHSGLATDWQCHREPAPSCTVKSLLLHRNSRGVGKGERRPKQTRVKGNRGCQINRCLSHTCWDKLICKETAWQGPAAAERYQVMRNTVSERASDM